MLHWDSLVASALLVLDVQSQQTRDANFAKGVFIPNAQVGGIGLRGENQKQVVLRLWDRLCRESTVKGPEYIRSHASRRRHRIRNDRELFILDDFRADSRRRYT